MNIRKASTLADLPAALAEPAELWLYGKSAPTQTGYLRDLWAFCEATGVATPADLTYAHLVRYDAELRARGVAENTRGRALAVLKSFVTFLHAHGDVARNFGALAKNRRADDPNGRRTALALEEVFRLFGACRSPRDRAVCRTLYYSGARVAEVARLAWRHVTTDDKGHGLLTLHGKGSKTRVVPVHAFLYAELIRLRAGADAEASVFGLCDRQLRRIVTDAGRRARIPEAISPHWLRHTHGTHADRGRAPISVIRESLGHKSAATTMGYLHMEPGDGSGLYLPAL